MSIVRCPHKVTITGTTLKNNVITDKIDYILCLLCGKVQRKKQGEEVFSSWK